MNWIANQISPFGHHRMRRAQLLLVKSFCGYEWDNSMNSLILTQDNVDSSNNEHEHRRDVNIQASRLLKVKTTCIQVNLETREHNLRVHNSYAWGTATALI